MDGLTEVDNIKKYLSYSDVMVPGKVLEKAILLPEALNWQEEQNKHYPRVTDLLLKNPFPKAKKKKGKKKKGKK